MVAAYCWHCGAALDEAEVPPAACRECGQSLAIEAEPEAGAAAGAADVSGARFGGVLRKLKKPIAFLMLAPLAFTILFAIVTTLGDWANWLLRNLGR